MCDNQPMTTVSIEDRPRALVGCLRRIQAEETLLVLEAKERANALILGK